MHQFLERGVPKALRSHDRTALAEWLGLRSGRVAPRLRAQAQALQAPPSPVQAAAAPERPVSAVREMAVDASAGPGRPQRGQRCRVPRAGYMPDAMIRHEGRAAPENLRILGARGDSMEPLIGEGDRIVVDVSRRAPVTGEMAVLWDGGGLVVKRVRDLLRSEPPSLRLHSTNPAYEPYTCLVDEAHIVGKVLWTIRKV